MKFWLIVFLFTSDGDFIGKREYQNRDKAQCVQLSGKVARQYVNSQLQLQFYCVTDDHFRGRSVDRGIPLD